MQCRVILANDKKIIGGCGANHACRAPIGGIEKMPALCVRAAFIDKANLIASAIPKAALTLPVQKGPDHPAIRQILLCAIGFAVRVKVKR